MQAQVLHATCARAPATSICEQELSNLWTYRVGAAYVASVQYIGADNKMLYTLDPDAHRKYPSAPQYNVHPHIPPGRTAGMTPPPPPMPGAGSSYSSKPHSQDRIARANRR